MKVLNVKTWKDYLTMNYCGLKFPALMKERLKYLKDTTLLDTGANAIRKTVKDLLARAKKLRFLVRMGKHCLFGEKKNSGSIINKALTALYSETKAISFRLFLSNRQKKLLGKNGHAKDCTRLSIQKRLSQIIQVFVLRKLDGIFLGLVK